MQKADGVKDKAKKNTDYNMNLYFSVFNSVIIEMFCECSRDISPLLSYYPSSLVLQFHTPLILTSSREVCMPQISPCLGNTEKSFQRRGKLNWVLVGHTVANFNRIKKIIKKTASRELYVSSCAKLDTDFKLEKPADLNSFDLFIKHEVS